MNPNVMFAFIGEPLVAMQIMKLYQKEKKVLICIYQQCHGEKYIITNFRKYNRGSCATLVLKFANAGAKCFSK